MVFVGETERNMSFVMLSASADSQTAADVFDTGSFSLPRPAGKAGGASTSTFLKVLNEAKDQQLSWMELLYNMRRVLKQKGFDQIPQLSASKMLDVDDRFEIVPQKSIIENGARRAILIGINYVGQDGQLSGCHNDVENIKRYLITQQGFQEKDILILMDDGVNNYSPTRKNILDSFHKICTYSKPNDVVFVHYSGHGGRLLDTSGDENDGYDETLIPVDFTTKGQIVDDDIYENLVRPMEPGVNVTVLMDCCHSGTALDLKYEINATDTGEMRKNEFYKRPEESQGGAVSLCC